MGVRQTSRTSGSWRASRKGEQRRAGFKQWPGKSLLRRDILTEEEQAEGTAIVKAPKCASRLTRCTQLDRAGRGISSEVPRDACCYQAAGEWGGAIVAQVTFLGSAVLHSLVSRGKWNLSGRRCLCDAALSFLPSAWVWSHKPVHVTVDGCKSHGFHHPTESSKALLVTCRQLCLGVDSCLEPISLFIRLAPNRWGQAP